MVAPAARPAQLDLVARVGVAVAHPRLGAQLLGRDLDLPGAPVPRRPGALLEPTDHHGPAALGQ